MKDNLLLVGIVSFAGGILLRTYSHVSLFTELFVVLLAVGFFFFWFFAKRDWYLVPAVLLALVSVGMLRTSLVPTTPTALDPLLGVPSTLTGTIVADPDIREGSQRVTVDVGIGSTTAKILAVTETFVPLTYGERVTVRGVLQKPKPFDTDGGRMFAYDTFLAKDGIFAVMQPAQVYVLSKPTNLLIVLQRELYAFKHTFVRALQAALPEPHASLAEGLLAGGKQGLGKNLLDDFTVAGLLPVIVLSGYNVMIVAESVLALLGFLPKRYAFGMAALAIALFVLTAGGGASALRAGLMALLALFARATGRTYDALRALLVVFVVMLLINPLLLAYDPGFQFSFAATLGLMLASSPLEVWLRRIRPKVLRELLATTLAAQLFVLPLLLYQTGNLSLVAIPANVLVLVVVPLAMGLSAIAGCVGLVLPTIATFVGLPAYALLSYIIGVATISASFPFARVILPAFPFWVVPLAYVPIAYLVLTLKRAQPAP